MTKEEIVDYKACIKNINWANTLLDDIMDAVHDDSLGKETSANLSSSIKTMISDIKESSRVFTAATDRLKYEKDYQALKDLESKADFTISKLSKIVGE